MGLRPLTLVRHSLRSMNCFKLRKKEMINFSTSALRKSETKENGKCEEDVIFECLSGGKGLITLNRPKQLNALSESMVCKIRQKLMEWEPEKYLIVVKGAGDKAFCAGGDVVAVTKDPTGEIGKKFFREEYKMDALISCLKVPYVALISGIVMGGGVGISLFGKYRIATETSMFAMPETQIGFFPDVGVSYHLARMPNHLGNFLALTGYRLKGYDLVHAGIATHFCTKNKLCELEKALLCDFSRDCCSCPEDIIKEFHDEAVKSMEGGCPPKFTLEPHLNSINCWFSECTIEGVMSKISQDKSKFATDSLETLNKMSPLSLKVTQKLIREAADLDIFNCFNVDYRVALKMLSCGDFVEGVRALLVDKDNKPKWKHDCPSKVKDDEVNNFFCKGSCELNLPDSIYEPCES